MTATRLDVLCIGNAIVDVIAKGDDALLAKHKLSKGAMMLIDTAQAESFYGAIQCPGRTGGSAAAAAARREHRGA